MAFARSPLSWGVCLLVLLGGGSHGASEDSRSPRVVKAERLEADARRLVAEGEYAKAESAALLAIDLKRGAYRRDPMDPGMATAYLALADAQLFRVVKENDERMGLRQPAPDPSDPWMVVYRIPAHREGALLSLYGRAATLLERKHGPVHEKLAETCLLIAAIYDRIRLPQETIRWAARALRALGPAERAPESRVFERALATAAMSPIDFVSQANRVAFFGLYPKRWAMVPYAERYVALLEERAPGSGELALACQRLALLLMGKDGEAGRITALYDRALDLFDRQGELAETRRLETLAGLAYHLFDIGELETMRRRCARCLSEQTGAPDALSAVRGVLRNCAHFLEIGLSKVETHMVAAIEDFSLLRQVDMLTRRLAIQDQWPRSAGGIARRLARERIGDRGKAEDYALLGLAQLASGHLDDAVSSYERALAESTRRPVVLAPAHARVAYAACVAEDYEKARQHAKKAHEFTSRSGVPSDAAGFVSAVNYASILTALGDLDGAQDVLDGAMPAFWKRPELRAPFERIRYHFDAVEGLLRELGRFEDVRSLAQKMPVRTDRIDSDYSAGEAARLEGNLREALRLEREYLAFYESETLDKRKTDATRRRLVRAEILLESGLEDEALAELIEIRSRLEMMAVVKGTLVGSDRMSPYATELFSIERLAQAVLRRGMRDQGLALARRAHEIHSSFGLGPDGRMLPALRASLEARLVRPVLERNARPLPPLESRASEILARALHMRGESEEAVRVLEEALAALRVRVRAGSPRVGRALNALAKLLLALGRFDDAKLSAAEALANLRTALGPGHPDVADSEITAGDIALLSGDPARARAHYKQCLIISKDALFPTHVNFVLARSGVALSASADGEHDLALATMRKVLDTVATRLEVTFAGATSQARMEMRASVHWVLANWLKVSGAAGEAGYDEVLRLKARVGRSLADETRVLRAAKGEAKAGAEALDLARRRLARLANRAPRYGWKRHAWRRDVAKASAEVATLSKRLARLAPEFAKARKPSETNARVLGKRLKRNEALLDVLLTGGRYTAWVLTKGKAPIRIDLGPEDGLTAKLQAFRDATREASNPADARFLETGRAVSAALLVPLCAPLPADVDTLYVVPDGPLAATPIQALPLESDQHLLDRYLLVRLQSAHDLLPRPREESGEGALLVGGVDFDQVERLSGPARPVVTGARKKLRDRVPGMPRFLYLPASQKEVAWLEERLSKDEDQEVVMLSQERASERRVREAVVGKRVLHLATHGLVRNLDARLRIPQEEVLRLREGLERYAQSFDPFLMSGLALAGVNLRETEGDDDGLLTALEVISLDLRGTELAFLSACDTARGVDQAGEGVLGLARAFTLAGARQVVASLWPVDDDATLALVRHFYEGRTSRRPKPAAAALRSAALALRGDESFKAPRHWAAFVAFGPLR